MKTHRIAIALVALTSLGCAQAQAYAFRLDYTYAGNAFDYNQQGAFQDQSVAAAGVVYTSADAQQPDFISFANNDIRLFFNQGAFFIATSFDALGGRGYTSSNIGAAGPLGQFTFGAPVYGSDADQVPLLGTLQGTLTIAAVSAVPLPGSAALLGSALLALAGLSGRVRRMRPAPATA